MTTHRLSGTAGIYLCCRVFCFESYLREIQIKKNQIDQKRVKCQGHMVNALWNSVVKTQIIVTLRAKFLKGFQETNCM